MVSRATASSAKPILARSRPSGLLEDGVIERSMASTVPNPVQHVLTVAQRERRRRVLSAARALATKGGYEAVTISAVAARAGVSRSTLYHYFGSKGHLLSELTLSQAEELDASFDARPVEGASSEERIANAMERIVDWALQKPNLFQAVVSAWTSSDAINPGEVHSASTTMLAQFTSGFRDTNLARCPENARLLEHVLFSCFIRLNQGLTTRDQAVTDLKLAAKLLIEPTSASD